jgi:hypothetical protein
MRRVFADNLHRAETPSHQPRRAVTDGFRRGYVRPLLGYKPHGV